MRLHDRFEWDGVKATTNLAKHGMSFDDAELVLADPDGDRFHVEDYDDEHSRVEDRYITTGSDPLKRSRVLVIVWTLREDDGGPVTRIISARAATSRERKEYASKTGHRNQ